MPDLTYDDLAAMWQQRDPMPPGLVDKVLVAVAVQDLDDDYELLHLVERSRDLVGTRGPVAEALTIVFSNDTCSVMMRISPLDDGTHRVDGWLSPPRAATVSLRQQDAVFETTADARGRFEVGRLPQGATRAVLSFSRAADTGTEPTEPTEQLFVTPAFEL